MNEFHSALDRLIQDVVEAADEQSGSTVTDNLRDALNAIGSHAEQDQIRRELAARLAEIRSPAGAGIVAIWLGAGVEAGLDPDAAIPSLFETILRWSKTIPLSEDGGAPASLDDDLQVGMQWLGQSLVAHLARSPALRTQFSTREAVVSELDRTGPVAVGCCWVAEMLRKQSGTLLVLHVAGRKGCLVSYENISNCFHLFTLLQGALARVMPGAKAIRPRVMAAARGESMEEVSDTAWWHYGRGDIPESNLMASIWGEGSPQQIPQVDGYQVVLLWPPILSGRSWDGGFFHPFLSAAPPRVTFLNQLTPEQLDRWWTRIGLPELPGAPWWKLW